MRRILSCSIFLGSLVFLCLPVATYAVYGDTSTYFSELYWGDKGYRTHAYLDFPRDVAFNNSGKLLIADTYNNVIRRINGNGNMVTLAGTGSYGDKDGNSKNAKFAHPSGVAVGGGAAYVADTENGKIRRIRDDKVTTLVDGLNNPEGVALYGNTLYFLDTGNNQLKKVSVNGGAVTAISGSLDNPVKLDISSDGKYAYIADAGSHQVKRVDLSTTAMKVVAGTGSSGAKNGACNEAKFNNLWGMHLQNDNTIYVSDGDGLTDYIRKIDLNGCTVTTWAKDSDMAVINYPRGMDSYGNKLYIASEGIGTIERFALTDPTNQQHYAGFNRFNVRNDNPVLTGRPKFLQAAKDGTPYIYFSENNRIRKIKRGSLKRASLIAGNIVDAYASDDNVSKYGKDARFSDIPSFVVSRNGKKLYVVDRNNNRIREVFINTGEVRYLTGAGRINMRASQQNDFNNGVACPNQFDRGKDKCAYFNRPMGSVLSKDGKYMYVADAGNNAIRRVTVAGPKKGKVITIAGNGNGGFRDGKGTAARFNAPIGLAISKYGRTLYVADRDNHRIRMIKLKTREVTTLAGTGSAGYLDATLKDSRFSYPEWITRGKQKGQLFVSEVGSNRIRLIDRPSKSTRLVAGSGNRGFKNGSRKKAQFDNPRGMLALSKNKLLVADMWNDMVRAIDTRGEAPYTNPAPKLSYVSPNRVDKDWFGCTTAKVDVYGSNFRHGAVAYAGSYQVVNTYVVADNRLTIEIPICTMATGYYGLKVKNSDGQYSDTLVRGLAISQSGVTPLVDYWP